MKTEGGLLQPLLTRRRGAGPRRSGRLKIGDHWNAIRIIALSQSNPLKAIAEFVENSIDANAKKITIVRGKENGQTYLRIVDDGEGVPKNDQGIPNFEYVATHVCDSIKRQLKERGETGLQGEFGIGLLSFWVVGESLTLRSCGTDGRLYQMVMTKGKPSFQVTHRKTTVTQPGTELMIKPLLPGIRTLTGDRMQAYLASELRNRLLHNHIELRIVDRSGRLQLQVIPRAFEGRRLNEFQLLSTPLGNIQVELYLAEPSEKNQVALYRRGTRVLSTLSELEPFSVVPWKDLHLQGMIDAPFLSLTPGSRLGVVQDEAYAHFCQALKGQEPKLVQLLEAQQRAEEEKTSSSTLKTIQKAFKEALLMLPSEDYDWFDIQKRSRSSSEGVPPEAQGDEEPPLLSAQGVGKTSTPFYEIPGPLCRVTISPTTAMVSVSDTRTFAAICRDRKKHRVEQNLTFDWRITGGEGTLRDTEQEIMTFEAPKEPGLVTLELSVTQGDIVLTAQAIVTVTDELMSSKTGSPSATTKGLPGYTFQKSPSKLWRSKYDVERNLIIINNGHRDFVYASQSKALTLRYLCRLFAKELVLNTFPGCSRDALMERMVEIMLYTEENLR